MFEVVALLVYRPQSLNGLNLQEFCQSLIGELLGKRLNNDLELPVILVKLEIFDIFVRRLDQNGEVRLVLREVVFVHVESIAIKCFEVVPERSVDLVVLALPVEVLLVLILDPFPELTHECCQNLTCL